MWKASWRSDGRAGGRRNTSAANRRGISRDASEEFPFLHNGPGPDPVPDFVIRLKGVAQRHVILETKGHDPLREVKAAAAHRWCLAVNAEGSPGSWRFFMANRPELVRDHLTEAAAAAGPG